MLARPVEWVLIIFYGPSAHRATYGRGVKSTKYTKDYIQLSRKEEFVAAAASLFAITTGATGSVPLTFRWPNGFAPGDFVFKSADRPHLKWGTSQGAPRAWKMAPRPDEGSEETLPGDPTHVDFADAERELELLAVRGAGQPYLLAIKLRDEPRTLHLRAYLENPSQEYSWASLDLLPQELRILASKTSQRSAIEWSMFQSGGVLSTPAVDQALSTLVAAGAPFLVDQLDPIVGRELTDYLRFPGHGLFFDPTQNHDAWLHPIPLSMEVTEEVDALLSELELRFPPNPGSDAAAEALTVDPAQVENFRLQIAKKNYGVADSVATVKTRGSAQRAFADAVKSNYGFRCAITGISTKDFLVAAHIVPWSVDQSIRLDPTNGICLSLLVDRAFENGQLRIEDDLTLRIEWQRVEKDEALRNQLEAYDGKKLTLPAKQSPQISYLQRRRDLIASTQSA